MQILNAKVHDGSLYLLADMGGGSLSVFKTAPVRYDIWTEGTHF